MNKLFIMLFIVLLFTCNYGLENGSDLESGWSRTDDEVFSNLRTIIYEFFDDGTGLKVYIYDPGTSVKYTFDYDIKKTAGSIYNKLILTNMKIKGSTKTSDLEEEKFNYYFNSTKDVLYLKEYKHISGTAAFWVSLSKQKYKYKD